MHLAFFEPPHEQKVGGLDQAIRSLRDCLTACGFSVSTNQSGTGSATSADVVHFHGLWQWPYLTNSSRCRQLRLPYVVSPHGMLEPWAWRQKIWKKLPYYLLFERHHLRGASAVLATSQLEASNLARFISPSRIRVIPIGLPSPARPDYPVARARLGWSPDETVLLYLSRIHVKKGLLLLLQALSRLADQMTEPWKLCIVGDGDPHYTNACRRLATSNPALARHVQWVGAVWGEEKWDYYKAADLFCLPTFSENFGLAILEAAQVGTRVLTTHETPWGFLSDWNGAFITRPDSVDIQGGLHSFLANRQWSMTERDELSNRIHARFAWETVGQAYIRLYQELAGQRT